MKAIKQQDLIDSVADALQYISYFHPPDYIRALGKAYELEQSPAARDAIAQILTNSRMCAEGRRPICQDTGIVMVFAKVGMNVRWDASMSFEDMINEGVRRAYLHPDNKLRASIVSDPNFSRKNTKDNTPAVIHTRLVPGDELEITVAAKGGGSENKSKFVMLNPSDSLVDWVLKTVPLMGAGWCPPGMLGIGIGGSAEKAMLLAKEALMEPIDMAELKARGPAIEDRGAAHRAVRQGERARHRRAGPGRPIYRARREDLRVPDARRIQAGRDDPELRGHAARAFHARRQRARASSSRRSFPTGRRSTGRRRPDARRVNLDTLTPAEVASWKPGESLLLNGRMLTGRDAAHKRIADLFAKGEGLPPGVDFRNRVIYYVGPVDPVRGEVVGPAGPTTATRMDKFTEMMLEKTGLIAMVGKAERGPAGIEAIRKHRAAYLMAVGGAAYLVSKAIKASRVVAFEDLGMEAIYEFTVEDMPVTVAVDANGTSVHQTGPAEWSQKIAGRKFGPRPLISRLTTVPSPANRGPTLAPLRETSSSRWCRARARSRCAASRPSSARGNA